MMSIIESIISVKNVSKAVDFSLIFLVLVGIYHVLKGTKIFQVFIGFLTLAVANRIASHYNLNLTAQAIKFALDNSLIVLLIIFQEDVKKFFNRIGNALSFSKKSSAQLFNTSSEIISSASNYMSKKKTGALIIFERSQSLNDYVSNGVVLNADISYELILSIFDKRSLLHDGAIIIKNDKIISASNVLPMKQIQDLDIKYGTRHRAAIGISEETDCLVVVVSEERSEIKIVENGVLTPPLSKEELKRRLDLEISEENSKSNKLGLIADKITEIINKFKKK